MPAAEAAIGVFDSGVGGLSVLREVRAALPAEHLLYVADSGAAPYGDRPAEFILERAQAIVAFFLEQNIKAIVVACNTATAVAIQSLRARYPVPLVAIEPAVKPAAAQSRSGVIGILATSQTLASENFSRLRERYGQGVRVLTQACPGLVEQVEKGELQGEATQAMVAGYLAPLLAQGADTIVLGCTHYPFLLPIIRAAAGQGVAVIDPAQAVARELRRRLESGNLHCAGATPGTERFWTSGATDKVATVMAKLWGKEITVHLLP
ncbi:MAG: glutamate racemase [Betaproteobacteria bacterium RIFCSPLOWO2_02_FULL_62_17]|nr:MAG: glutamate racemase [Betaproteobacteria bacterium RIFCSPLOWO2_02_FULL_62_17]